MCPTSISQCVFIKKDGNSKPPAHAIRFNENSTRAFSKKDRIYVLRDFLLRTFPSLTPSHTILDVAGGRGDLSWILRNVDGITSVIADPRTPNHRRLLRSVQFLRDHPEEAAIRAVEGLATHQPLAKLLPRLRARRGAAAPTPLPADFMRLHVDSALVAALRALAEEGASASVWDDYWDGAQRRIGADGAHYGGTAPAGASVRRGATDGRIGDARSALEVFRSLDLIVGFHPDQATEAAIDLALLLGIPFVVVPCCVFPSEFPERTLYGKRVQKHGELIEYLCAKHCKIRKTQLPFVATDTAKNVALYLLKEDI